ncbi:MAG: FAD-dependent oxidoreductase [Verrucomicrobia bacterium]|nr:FAD-dependent oxidoreductase [Verrucomicrobiota bacterium]
MSSPNHLKRESAGSSAIPHVVALGSGYATFYAYRELAGWIRRKRVRMTVIDRNNYHCFHGLVPEMLAGKLQPGTILSSSRRLFKHAQFCNGEIKDIDLERRTVTFSRKLDGKEFSVNYDHLIVGVGSSEDLKRFPGIAEHTLRLKAFPDILQVRHHLITMLELAEIETDAGELERLLNFVVVGANYAGVEVAGELAEFLPNLARSRFSNIPADQIRITVIHSGERILPELGSHFPKLQAYAERVITDSPHLRLKTGIRLASATPEEAVLDNGERIPTRTIISCTGTAPAPVLEFFPAERDRLGRVVTDEFLRMKGVPNVWAAGDCAAVPHPQGGTCPPLAIWAMTAGRQLAKNLKATLSGRSLQAYRFTGLGDACTLGHHRAAAQLKGVPIRGLLGYLAWRFFMIRYLPAVEKKCRLVLDWLLLPVFGRDLINMNVHRPVLVTPVMHEPRQEIIREGDVGQSLFIIRSGEVEVLKQRPDGSGPEVVATLKAGDHFGEVAVFRGIRRTATVRARTRVELLHVQREAALALSESSHEIARTFSTRIENNSQA